MERTMRDAEALTSIEGESILKPYYRHQCNPIRPETVPQYGSGV